MKRKWPVLTSDAAAERFVETADLTEYDFAQIVPVRYEFEKKEAALNMRIPASLLGAVKAKARAEGLPYARYIRRLIERDLAQSR